MSNLIKMLKGSSKNLFFSLVVFFILIIPFDLGLSNEISKDHRDSLLKVIEEENKGNSNTKINENYLESALLVQKAISKIAKSSLNAVVSIKGVRLVQNDNYKVFNEFFKFFQPYPNRQLPKHKSIPQKQITMGSGFIIDKNGFIITNNHVVDNAKDIKVTLQNNDQYDAKIIFKSKNIDMALLKIETEKNNFSFISLGNSEDVNIGDFTIAVGNPFGSLSGTYTFGIVSSKARDIAEVDYSSNYNNYIQTDAAINIGNSGGPLLNIKGEVIGINTLIYSPNGVGFSGIGFAIPINFVKTVLISLIKTGAFKTSELGVSVSELDESIIEYFNLKSKNGCFVRSIIEGSPAEKSELESGDIILEFDGKLVKNCTALRNIIAYSSNKEEHTLKLFRNSKIIIIKVKLIEKQEKNEEEQASDKNNTDNKDYKSGNFLNMQLGRIEDFYSKFSLDKNLRGLIVISIDEDSNFQYSQPIKVGDIIEEINFEKVNSLEDIENIKKNMKDKKSFMLKIKTMYNENKFLTNFIVIKLQ